MSGHSKWSTIKRKKGANDAKRGKIFTKLARDITLAARQSGTGNPDESPALRLAVDRAKAQNMPKDNIERAIKRGTGELKDGTEIEEVTYEAYAGHGIALLIEVATDNRNRTIAEIKNVVTKAGGNMAEPGSVTWQFEQKGAISLTSGSMEFDDVFMIAAEAGAEDVSDEGDTFEITTSREDLHIVLQAVEDAGLKVEDARLDWVSTTPIELDPAQAMKVMSVVEQLEDLDDTQNVFSNLDINDELVAALEAAG